MDLQNLTLGDYVDLCCSETIWVVAKVTDLREDLGLRLDYRKKGSKQAEWLLPNSKRLAPFRTRTSTKEYFPIPPQGLDLHNMIDEAIHGLNGAQSECKEIIAFYRGTLYSLALETLKSKPSTREAMVQAVQFLTGFTDFVARWLDDFPKWQGHVASEMVAKEVMYTDENAALASMWPELFEVIGLILDENAQLYSSQFAPIFADQLNVSMLNIYFWQESIQANIVGKAANKLNDNLSQGDSSTTLAILTELPCWSFMLKHADAIANGRQCDDLIACMKYVFEAWDTHPNNAYADCCNLQTLWEAVSSARKYFYILGYETDGELLLKPVLALCANMITHQSIEKRISVVSLLDSISRDTDDLALSQSILDWIQSESIPSKLLSDLHPEVLNRCKHLVQWLHQAGLFPIDQLCSLFKSAASAHESYVDCVHSLLSLLIPSFSVEETYSLFEAIKSKDNYYLDKKTLQFITEAFTTLLDINAETAHFADEILQDLMNYISPEELATRPANSDIVTAIFQVCFDLLRLKKVRELAGSYIKALFSLILSSKDFQPRLLFQFLETFKGDEGFVSSLVSTLGEPIGRLFNTNFSCLLERYQAGQVPKEDIGWALKALDLLAGLTYQHDTKQSALSEKDFSDICVLLFLKKGDMREIAEEFLLFLVECANSSVWCVLDLLHLCLLTFQMPKAALFLMNLNTVCYQALFKLFLLLNKPVIDFEDTLILRVYTDMETYLVPVFVRMAVLPRDEEVREQALLHTNLLLTSCKEPCHLLTQEVLRNLFALMEATGDPSVHQSCLTVLRSCIEYCLKYSTLRRDPEELQLCARQCMQEAKSDPQAAYYDLQNYFAPNIASYAREKNAQYMQVRFVKPKRKSDEFLRNMVIAPYSSADFKAIMGTEYRSTLLKVFSSQSFAVHRLALWVVSALLPGSSLCSEVGRLEDTYKGMFQSKFDERTLILLALKELSKKPDFLRKYASFSSDLLQLLQLVNVPRKDMEAWVAGVQHRAVLYYEVLLDLIRTHFTQANKPIPATCLGHILAALEVISVYYLLPGKEKVKDTTLLQIVGDILVGNIKAVDCVSDIAETGYFPAFYERIFLHKVPISISQMSAELLQALCQADPRFNDYFLELLLEHAAEAIEKESTGYLTALSWLLKQPNMSPEFTKQIGDLSHVIQERVLTAENDHFSANLWLICDSLLQWYREDEVRNMLIAALKAFTAPTKRPQKALLSFIETVKNAFPSLESDILTDLSQYYRDISWRKSPASYWKLNPSSQTCSSARGFRNPGAICYMNSAFQQLFAISTFAEGILAVNPDPSQALLINFQRIIAKLQFKPSGSISAERILYSLRNEPMDTNEQTDIEEFFNEFMAKLESQLTEIGCFHLVSDHFNGISETSLIGKQGCTHTRASRQISRILSLAIKNKRNLQESLESYTKGELLTGTNMLNCEECGAKVPTESTVRAYHLPNIVVISLRRFEYSIEANRRYKLTDKFEFPMNLNLKSISNSTVLTESYYEYRLQGVIIHQGTAESGHYYSLVRKAKGWVKCNDEEITDFDEKDIEKEAFGGVSSQGKSELLERSAYLLIYARDQHYRCTEEQIVPIKDENSTEIAASVAEIRAKYASQGEINGSLSRLLSPEYMQFLLNLLSSPSLSAKSLIFSLSYFFTIYCRKASYAQEHPLLPALLAAIPKVPNIAFWTTEVIGNEGIIDELVLSAPIHVKKSLIIIMKEVLERANSSLIRHFLTRLIGKMESFKDCGAIEYTQFFELMYYAVIKSPQDALELQLCARLVTKLIPCTEEIEPIAPKEPVFTLDSYLGHPFPEPYRVHASSKRNLAFQLKILTVLFPKEEQWQRYFLENINLFPLNILLLTTEFELEQAAAVLNYSNADPTGFLEVISNAFLDKSDSWNGMRLLFIIPRVVSHGNSLITVRVIHLLLQVIFIIERCRIEQRSVD